MRRWWMVLFLVGCIALMGGPARAQYEGNDLSISLLIGNVWFDLSSELGNARIDLPTRQVFGLTAEYTIVPYIGVEGHVTVNTNDMTVPAKVGYKFDHWYLLASGVLRLNPKGRFNPYLLAGGGVTLLNPEVGGNVTEPTFHFGAGFDLFGSDQWALRVDARFITYKFTAADFDAVTQASMGIDPTYDARQWDFVIAFGLRWKP